MSIPEKKKFRAVCKIFPEVQKPPHEVLTEIPYGNFYSIIMIKIPSFYKYFLIEIFCVEIYTW